MSLLRYCYACSVRVNSVVVGIFERRARNSQYWKYLFLGDTEHVIFQWWHGDTRHINCQDVARPRKISPVHIWNCLSKWWVDGSLDNAMHLSAFLSSPVWSKLAELSFKIRQHLTIFATRRHLWLHFGLGVPALYCKYPKNGADWLKNMSFLVIPIYWRHSALTSQWDSKTSECREAVSSWNYD